MESVQYDPSLLQFHADELYRRAKWIAWGTAVRYGAGAFLIGIPAAVALSKAQIISDPSISELVLAIGTLVGGLVGFDIGTGRAFQFKLQAQQILCQRRIELNTRAALEIRGTVTNSGNQAPLIDTGGTTKA